MKTVLRRAVCAICAAVWALMFTVSASAKTVSQNGIKVTFPSEYIVLTTENLSDNEDFVESIGHTRDSLKKAMSDGNILFYAANKANTKQIHIKSWTTDFSKRVNNLSELDEKLRDATLESIKKILVEDGNQILFSNTFTHDNCLYLKLAVHIDAEEPFCYIQYVTVAGGKFYSMVYYNAHGYLSVTEQKDADKVLSTVKINTKGGPSIGALPIVETALIALLIIASLAVMFFIIRSFILDFMGKRAEPEQIPDRIKVKRK